MAKSAPITKFMEGLKSVIAFVISTAIYLAISVLIMLELTSVIKGPVAYLTKDGIAFMINTFICTTLLYIILAFDIWE